MLMMNRKLCFYLSHSRYLVDISGLVKQFSGRNEELKRMNSSTSILKALTTKNIERFKSKD